VARRKAMAQIEEPFHAGRVPAIAKTAMVAHQLQHLRLAP